QELWFVSNRTTGNLNLYRAPRSGAGFANPGPVRELNTSSDPNLFPTVSADRLTVYFATMRANTRGFDIWTSHRRAVAHVLPALRGLPRSDTRRRAQPRGRRPARLAVGGQLPAVLHVQLRRHHGHLRRHSPSVTDARRVRWVRRQPLGCVANRWAASPRSRPR